MKERRLYGLLAFETLILLPLIFSQGPFPVSLPSVLAFPLDRLAWLMKALAQGGRAGNGLVVMAWLGLSSLPMIYGLNKPQMPWSEKAALVFLSLALVLGLYGMANPYAFLQAGPLLDEQYLTVIRAIFASGIWSALVLFTVLKLVTLFKAGDTGQLLTYLACVMYALCMILVALLIFPLTDLLSKLRPEDSLLQNAFYIIDYFCSVMANLLTLNIIFAILNLIRAFEAQDDQVLLILAEDLSEKSVFALVGSALIPALFNFLQILGMAKLTDVSTSLQVPLANMLFVLIALLFSRLILENKRLKDENELFI